MKNFELELQEHILNYCASKNISIDLRFKCFGDENKFYTNDTEFSADCVEYYANGHEEIKRFLIEYIDIMWKNCNPPMNRIALYVEDIADMGGWYNMIIGGGLFEDRAEDEKNIKLGAKVRDKVTKFEGCVTARAEYLYDKPRVLVEGIDSTGRPIEWWYDESRVTEVQE